ncbi:MAG: outer membrane lipoprotein LolB [Gammaproteobacteria bacterium]
MNSEVAEGKLFLWVLLLTVGLSACVTTSGVKQTNTQDDEQNWKLRLEHFKDFDQWDIRGRVAIYVDDKVHTAGLRWIREGDQIDVVLEAPFGQGVMRILSEQQENAIVYSLKLPNQEPAFGSSPEKLLEQLLGWSLPVSGLTDWVKAVAKVDEPYILKFNSAGYPASIQQRGWRINYLDYEQTENSRWPLPMKMYLKHERLSLKLVIDSWQKKEPLDGTKETIEFPGFD